MMVSVEEGFRRLTLGDRQLMGEIEHHQVRARPLDPLTEALLRIGALIALDAPSSSYRAEVEAAMRVGARLEDLFAVLIAVAGHVGSARIASAAPRLAMAAGYDVEAALE